MTLHTVYNSAYRGGRYAHTARTRPEDHAWFPVVRRFVESYGLREARCLEVGCGLGAFQDLVPDYVGTDISLEAGRALHKPFVSSSATELPFPDDSFDAIWTIATFEHVPDPERGMTELRRVIRPGGLLLFAPAWHCRSWAAEGYPKRPYSDFGWRGRLVKLSIPVRDSVAFRAPWVLLRRARRLLSWWAGGRAPTGFRYRTLQPNYETIWMSDSDAVNSMDPFDAILWFISRGDVCLNYPDVRSAYWVRTNELVFQIRKARAAV